MKNLENFKEEAAREDGYNYFENIPEHLQPEYLQRANDAYALSFSAYIVDWIGEHYVKMHGGWMQRFADQRNLNNLIPTVQLIKMFRDMEKSVSSSTQKH